MHYLWHIIILFICGPLVFFWDTKRTKKTKGKFTFFFFISGTRRYISASDIAYILANYITITITIIKQLSSDICNFSHRFVFMRLLMLLEGFVCLKEHFLIFKNNVPLGIMCNIKSHNIKSCNYNRKNL